MTVTASHARTATLFVALAFAWACDDETDPPNPSATTSEGAPATAETSEEVAPTADERPPPGVREHDVTPEAALGTAPEGLGLAVGTEIPSVSAPDTEGNDVDLAALAEDGALMVVFYRGGWCPYCNFQVRALTEAYEELSARQVTPVLISVDQMSEASRTDALYEIPFPVLSDPDLAVHRAFSVVHEADDAEVARLREHGHDLEAFSGRDHHAIAVPSIFIIDRGGEVRWRHVDPAYRVRPSPAQLLTVIDSLELTANQ